MCFSDPGNYQRLRVKAAQASYLAFVATTAGLKASWQTEAKSHTTSAHYVFGEAPRRWVKSEGRNGGNTTGQEWALHVVHVMHVMHV